MTVYTIGYEGLNIDEFLSLLVGHDIETVVDIRELPLSRKPSFSKNSLAHVLNLSGFDYIHIADLGCPKPVRNKYREDGNWAHYTSGFLKHLKSQKAAISELAELAQSSSCALMCFEADFNFCHRSMVANAVKNSCGASVSHIQIDGLKTKSPAKSLLAFA